jgi:hypothetical protein
VTPGRQDFCGRQVIWAGLIAGSGGLLLGFFLRTIVERTPTQLPSYALFWLVVVLTAMGALGGMALEAVRQLQVSNPNPSYHPVRQRRQWLADQRRRRRHRS